MGETVQNSLKRFGASSYPIVETFDRSMGELMAELFSTI